MLEKTKISVDQGNTLHIVQKWKQSCWFWYHLVM